MTTAALARLGFFVIGLGAIAVGLDVIRGDALTDRSERIGGAIIVLVGALMVVIAWYAGGSA